MALRVQPLIRPPWRSTALAALLALAVPLALAACHGRSTPGPAPVPMGAPPRPTPVARQCAAPPSLVLDHPDVEAACGLPAISYLGVTDSPGCAFLFQKGPDRAVVRLQTRVGTTVAQAFAGVRVQPVSGVGDVAEEGFIRGDLWIFATQRGDRLAYLEADKRLCSEAQTLALLRTAASRLVPPQAPASTPLPAKP